MSTSFDTLKWRTASSSRVSISAAERKLLELEGVEAIEREGESEEDDAKDEATVSQLVLRPMKKEGPLSSRSRKCNVATGVTETTGIEQGGGRQLSEALRMIGEGGTGMSDPVMLQALLKKASLFVFEGACPVKVTSSAKSAGGLAGIGKITQRTDVTRCSLRSLLLHLCRDPN